MHRSKLTVVIAGILAAMSVPATAQKTAADRPPPVEATDALLDFEQLIGRWHPVQESLSDAYKAWEKANEISDSWVQFDWGTDRRWIDFSDWRTVPEGDRRQGAGIIAYDHGQHVIGFHEHGAREVSVKGTLTRTAPDTIVRDTAIITPTGGWRQVDRWTFDADGTCLTWASTRTRGSKSEDSPAYKMCRK